MKNTENQHLFHPPLPTPAQVRDALRAAEVLAILGDVPGVDCHGITAEEREELSVLVGSLLDRLGTTARSLLRRTVWGDESVDEVALALGLSLDAAALQLRTGLESIGAGLWERTAAPR